MKSFFSLFFLLLFLFSAQGENKAYEMKSPPALQFLTHLFDTMKRVSPEQNEAYQAYEKQLLELLKKARKLDLEYHKEKSRGLKGENARINLIKKGKEVLNKALDKTDLFLESLQKAIKSERSKIVLELYPQLKES